MDEFIVQLLTKLDTSKVIQDYNDLKIQLEKEINIKVNLDTSSSNDISKFAEQLQSALSKVSNGKLNLDTSQITTALEQVIRNAQQAGEKTGNVFSRGVSSTVKSIKKEIKNTINEISRLDANKIIENLNLNRASIGTDVTNQVRSLVSEINILGREVAKTGSDNSWEKLITKCSELGNKLDSFGKIRSFPGIEDIKKFADYFDGKIISTGYKNSGLSGTDFNTSQLNKELKQLGVQFSSTKQNAIELDSIWEEMCNTTGRMDLLNVTSAQDQIQTVISELHKAQSILNGEKGLANHPNARNVVSEYIDAVTKARAVVKGYENEISTLTQKESQSSITSTNTIVQNEQKKQEAYKQTSEIKKQLLEGSSLIESGAGNTVDFKSITTAVSEARNHFKNLLEDEKTVITTLKHFNGDELNAFTVNVKRASGEVESLNYKVKGSQILFDGGKINDTSAMKQIEQVEKKYTEFFNKLSDLKSKLTGTNFNYSSFDKMLEKFHNGEITVNELSMAFNELKNAAETSMKGLNSQSSSFNPIQQAQNNMRDLPSMLTALETGMNGLKDKTSLTDVSVQDLVSTYNSLRSEMDAVGGKVPLTDEWITKYQNLMSTVASLTEQVKALKKVEASDNSAVKLTNQANKIQLSIDTGGYESKVESLISKTRQWTDENGTARISTDALSKALDKLTTASNTLANNNTIENQKALIKAENELDIEVKKVTNSIRTMNATLAKDSTISSLHNQIQKFYDNNGAAHRKWGAQLKQMLRDTASGAELTKDRVAEIKTAFNGVVSAAQQAGKVGKSWFQSLRDATKFLTYWTSPTFITMKAISEIKQGITSIKELDTALVDLKKTTTMTSNELEDFYYDSNKVAKQMGVTTNEIISQASAWSRLGFSSAEAATKMAELSSKFASISPGMSTDQAQEGLVSIIKAWGLNINDVEREVMDNINTLGKFCPILQ